MASPAPQSADAAYIDRPERSRGDWLFRAILITGALAVTVMAGLYVSNHLADKRANETVVDHVMAEVHQEQLEKTWLATALREKRVILGMTRTEVEMAKGEPYRVWRGNQVPEVHRERGAAETWGYHMDGDNFYTVLFDQFGLVIYSRDVGDIPAYGNAIRQR